jgi:predicted small metal-binding protein
MYVSCVNEVVSDINIQISSTHDHDYCTENFMNKIKSFMTDTCVGAPQRTK